jgi:hypothetical protein
MTSTEHLSEVRLRGARVPAFGTRHSVADARGADAPAHPPLTLIAERGGLARDSRARSRYARLGSLLLTPSAANRTNNLLPWTPLLCRAISRRAVAFR